MFLIKEKKVYAPRKTILCILNINLIWQLKIKCQCIPKPNLII